MKFNTKGWKKVGGADDHTMLQNNDGHQLKILHHALSPKLRGEIASLPQVDYKEGRTTDKSKGEIKKPMLMADGGDVDPAPQEPKKLDMVDSINTFVHKGAPQKPAPEDPPKYAKGTPEPIEQDASDNYFSQHPELLGLENSSQANADTQRSNTAAPVTIHISNGGGSNSQPQVSGGGDQSQQTPENVPQAIGDTLGQTMSSMPPDQLAQYLHDNPAQIASSVQNTKNAVASQITGQPMQPVTPNQVAPTTNTPTPQGSAPDVATPPPANPGNTGGQGQAQPIDDFGTIMGNSYKLEAKGLKERMLGEQELSKTAQDIQGQAAKSMQDLQTQYQDTVNKSLDERASFQRAIQEGHIKPNDYIENMGATQKVGTAIGLLLSGIGSGMTGQSNMAMDFLNKQIDRDIQAQVTNLGASENLLANNLNEFHNYNDAYAMTRTNIIDGYMHQLDQAAAKNMGAQAQSAYHMAKSQLDRQAAVWQSGIGKGVLYGQGGTENQFNQYAQSLRMMGRNSDADALMKRVAPGVGYSNKDIPQDEIKEMGARKDLDNTLSELIDFQKKYGTDITAIANPAVVSRGLSLAGHAGDLYRSGQGQGTFRKGEKEFVDNLIPPDPTMKIDPRELYNNLGKGAKYKEALNSNRMQYKGLLSRNGIHEFTNSGVQSQSSFTPNTVQKGLSDQQVGQQLGFTGPDNRKKMGK